MNNLTNKNNGSSNNKNRYVFVFREKFDRLSDHKYFWHENLLLNQIKEVFCIPPISLSSSSFGMFSSGYTNNSIFNN